MKISSDLETFLATHNIPKIKGKPKTFLGISKQPHYENVLSNIYAFFFNVNEVHRMGDLFIKSLIECIDYSALKEKDFKFFEGYEIKTEYTTKNGGRIDLLLYNATSAIILENKVNHHLNNHLDDYWESVELETETDISKIGIILSLKPVSRDQYGSFVHSKEYINITHLQLMKTVMKNREPYLERANNKFIVFLDDLNQNIMNISRSYLEAAELAFYLEHQQKINDLYKFNQDVREHIVNEIELAGEGLEDVNLQKLRKDDFNYKRLRYYASKVHPDLVITALFENILNERQELFLIVEVRSGLLDLETKEQFLGLDFTSEEKEQMVDSFALDKNPGWAHFASKAYKLSADQLANLAEFIDQKLRKDHLLSIFRKLEESVRIKSASILNSNR